MSKSLEALESLISMYINIQNGTNMIFNKSKILEELNLIKQDLERLEVELHCKNNSIKTLEAFHKSQIENYLQKENKLLDELIICKQQIKILKKALPYYNIKVLCNAGRITEEELEVLLKYEVLE